MGADYSTEDLRGRLSSVTVVEALGPPYFGTGHIPGAVNIPPHRVVELAPTLLPAKDAPIVVYAAHRFSHGADVVVRQLALLGYRDVSRYVEGKAGWAEAGLPLIEDGEG
ncbi:Rhodanese-like domain-containing protein [Geodermatophilus amargosae]|uniref:Rhodanese-like domain-containing protein n=1 Tax=Geodermatophilus amargosae TaxID=1296565 RepID=A0A1I7D5H4_9ACTN|nr:rhodanese-like domain-containing protein [Geodermatophilus amargosae]SFU06940.1 Rhodanese-like domain-containing protein [Geodermatophilus amargosae]